MGTRNAHTFKPGKEHRLYRHGRDSGDPTYCSWAHMLDRCLNPNHHAFKHYGGRSITVCERWLDFLNFFSDMGERPPGKSLDRFPNNDGAYGPGNCRWATTKEQALNKRKSSRVYGPLSEEQKSKMSASRKGKPWTQARWDAQEMRAAQ